MRVFDRRIDLQTPILETVTDDHGLATLAGLTSDPTHVLFVEVEAQDGSHGAEAEFYIASLSAGRVVEVTMRRATCRAEVVISGTP